MVRVDTRQTQSTSILPPAKDGYVGVEQSDKKNTGDEDRGSWQTQVLTAIPTSIQFLEERAVFTLSILAMIGYIVIASAGKMTTIKDFVLYVIFILSVSGIYKLYQYPVRAVSLKSRTLWCLTIAVVVLLVLLVATNMEFFATTYQSLKMLLRK